MNVGELKKRLQDISDDTELLVIDWFAGAHEVLNGHLFKDAQGDGYTYTFYVKSTVLTPPPVLPVEDKP